MTTEWDEFIPDVDPEPERSSFSVDAAREALRDYGIINAYRRWCGKSEPNPGGRTEGIMVSCPRPDHPDRNPSAWLNSDNNTWCCGGCGFEGGDIIDLGAFHYGYAVPEYKTDARFGQLLRQMLTDIGVEVDGLPQVDWQARAAAAGIPTDETTLPAASAPEFEDFSSDGFATATMDWTYVATPGSFLDLWMQRTTGTEVPDEYLLWLGLAMVGAAVGRERTVKGARFKVYPNLMLTLIGPTGVGKSLATRLARELLTEALPFDEEDRDNRGVAMIPRPGSGEALIDSFAWVPSGTAVPLPVRGVLDVDELSSLMHAARRRGSTLRETIITLYDGGSMKTRARSTGTTAVEARDPFLIMFTGIQPGALTRALEDIDVAGGFLNRFCLIQGTPKPLAPWDEDADVDMTGLAIELQAITNWARRAAGPWVLTDDAVPTWEALRLELHALKDEGDLFARFDLTALKLLMILAANDRSDVVTLDHVERAWHLIDFLIPTATDVDKRIGKSENAYITNRVLEVLTWYEARRGRPPSQADIRAEFPKGFRDNHTDRIYEVINKLERQGSIAALLAPQSGKKRYRRND